MVRVKRILVCAFACHPTGDSGLGSGEDILGWNVASQLGRFRSVWVLTSSLNRGAVEEARSHGRVEPGVVFVFVDLPRPLHILLQFRGGIQLYAYLWQIRALFVALRLHNDLKFDLFHHVTYANDWMASHIGALLPVCYVRGPCGGAQRIPALLRSWCPFRDRAWEVARSAGQWFFRRDPFFVLGQHRAKVLLVCNRESLAAVPARWRDKAEICPVNGISRLEFELIRGTPADNRSYFRVLTAGRLLPLKGFAIAVEGFSQFVARGYGSAELVILGDGPDLPRLTRLVEDRRLQSHVKLKGWWTRNAFLKELRNSDVFVFMSLRDGGGAVVVEAMAAGKPVICLDVAGPAMHVTEECGIKIPPRARGQITEDVAAALEIMRTDETLRHRMGEAGRKRAESAYDWDALGERLLALYDQVLVKGPA